MHELKDTGVHILYMGDLAISKLGFLAREQSINRQIKTTTPQKQEK